MLSLCMVVSTGIASVCTLSARSHAAEAIRIAVALPQSGPWEQIGKDARNAALLAYQNFKSLNGSKTEAVELLFYDDACSAEGGARVARQVSLLEPRPVAILGHACPSSAQSAAAIYSAANMVFMAAGFLPARQATPRKVGSMQFSLPGDQSQAAVIASALVKAGDARVAVVRDRTQYAIDTTQAIVGALGPAARAVVVQESIAGGDKNFMGLAQRIKAAGVSHLVLSAFPSEAGLLIEDIRKLSPSLTILASDQLAEPGFSRSFPAAAEGVLVPLPVDYDEIPSASDVLRQISPSNAASARIAIATYSALECMLAATRDLQKANSVDLAHTLSARPFDTVLGAIRFDASGSASLARFKLFTWHGGQLVSAAQRQGTAPDVATRPPLP